MELITVVVLHFLVEMEVLVAVVEEQEVSWVEPMVPMVVMDLLVVVEVQLKLELVEMVETE